LSALLGILLIYFFMVRQAMPDMLLTLFLCGAMGFLALGRFDSAGKTRSYCLFYACVALAFLTKGPLALAVTLGALLIFWSLDFDPRSLTAPGHLWNEFKTMLSRYRVGWGILIFIVIAGPWYTVIWFTMVICSSRASSLVRTSTASWPPRWIMTAWSRTTC
jgi:4-amino-4-deoxy-L-arabinose transferase-like glycosyltransferase